MNINQLILIVKKKIEDNISIEEIKVEDKTFLHKNHQSHKEGKFHLKVIISSIELKKMNKIKSSKTIYKILGIELEKYIHSIQILIN
jgi:BolA protein